MACPEPIAVHKAFLGHTQARHLPVVCASSWATTGGAEYLPQRPTAHKPTIFNIVFGPLRKSVSTLRTKMTLTRALGTEHLLTYAVRVSALNPGQYCLGLTCLCPAQLTWSREHLACNQGKGLRVKFRWAKESWVRLVRGRTFQDGLDWNLWRKQWGWRQAWSPAWRPE